MAFHCPSSRGPKHTGGSLSLTALFGSGETRCASRVAHKMSISIIPFLNHKVIETHEKYGTFLRRTCRRSDDGLRTAWSNKCAARAARPYRLADSPEARMLVEHRERQLKKGRSRFRNARAREQWSGRAGLRPMTYRWEVASPGGGAFHPKLWILRFVAPDDDDEVLLRLLVLSRARTSPEIGRGTFRFASKVVGQPRGGPRAANRALADLVRDLPRFARGAIADTRRAQAQRLAGEVHRTDWTVPEPFDSVRFHVVRAQRWLPAPSRRLAVISPFVAADALSALAETTDEPVALVSRPETLAALEADPAGTFEHVFAVDDAAESDDGEEALERDTMGLHAKVYLAENGGQIHLYVGSANATSAALIAGRNVEVLAELTGRRFRVGGVDALLGEEGLGGYLVRRGAQNLPRQMRGPMRSGSRRMRWSVRGSRSLPLRSASTARRTPDVGASDYGLRTRSGSTTWPRCGHGRSR